MLSRTPLGALIIKIYWGGGGHNRYSFQYTLWMMGSMNFNLNQTIFNCLFHKFRAVLYSSIEILRGQQKLIRKSSFKNHNKPQKQNYNDVTETERPLSSTERLIVSIHLFIYYLLSKMDSRLHNNKKEYLYLHLRPKYVNKIEQLREQKMYIFRTEFKVMW